MALYFYTSNPQGLLNAFKGHIENGRVKTWEVDDDGDFTFTARQWRHLAWLRPRTEPKRLALYILNPKGQRIGTYTYAIFHGRFMESILGHCDDLFSTAEATAMPQGEDLVAPPAEAVD